MLPFHGKYPKLDPKSCVMPGAELAGDVELKEYASIWQNCALRGDVNKIVVGRYSNVQDNSVLHVDDDKACILGDYVTIGHGAIVHASTIEDNVLVGMGAIVLSGCHVGSGSIIAAGAVVKYCNPSKLLSSWYSSPCCSYRRNTNRTHSQSSFKI